MQQSFYTALSGASTHQKGLDTWSNNISNINTAGFRADKVEFKSLMTDSVRNTGQANSGTANRKAFGSTTFPVQTNFTQASIVNTNNEFDLSINGDGFFIVGDLAGNLKYTRDGSFTKDSEGYLVNSAGYYLYGVDLEKVKDNVFTPDQSNEELKTHDLTHLQRIKIPNGTVYKPRQTTTMDMGLNLNSSKNIKSINNAYNSMLYDKDITFLSTRPLSEFINIKDGDILQINTQGQPGTPYIYGTDFTNVDDLRKLLVKDREDISLSIEGGMMTLTNISGDRLTVNYEGSSDEVKNALSLENAVLGKEGKILLAPFSQRQQYNTNFNALYAKNEFPVHIRRGDDFNIEIDGVIHTMFYGGSDELKIGNKTIPKEDTFFTIGDLVEKLEKKANLEVSLVNGRIQLKNTSPVEVNIKITSSNIQLVSDLGLQPNSTVAPDTSVSSYPFGVSTYTNALTVFDKSGNKYNVRANYVSQAPIRTDSDERWHASYALYDGNKLISFNNIYGEVEFGQDGAKVTTTSFDPEDNTTQDIDKFTLKFPGNDSISINLKGTDNTKATTNLKYIDSSIADKEIDGNTPGDINGLTINDQGNIVINFSNQEQEVYGRIGLADFVNRNGLQKVGNNMFAESYVVNKNGVSYPASGGAKIIWDKNGQIAASIGQRSIETSNVELTRGLTQLIVMQRSFAANAKAISTSDEMVQQAINLKS